MMQDYIVTVGELGANWNMGLRESFVFPGCLPPKQYQFFSVKEVFMTSSSLPMRKGFQQNRI